MSGERLRYLIGVGNYAAGDDAIGLRLVEEIVEQGLDLGFRAIDLSSNNLDLVSYLTPETEAILIIDSAKMGLAPGEVRFFSPDEVETRRLLAGVSTHEGDVLKVLEFARAAGFPLPRLGIIIMGIEPESVEPRLGLSKTLSDRTAGYVAAAIDRLMTM